jgi:hypothetical protein
MVAGEGDVFFVDDPTTWLRKLFCLMDCFVQTLLRENLVGGNRETQ